MALPYSFRLAVQSILHEKWINLLSVLTIAAGLIFTAMTALSVQSIDRATGKLPEKFSVLLYVNDNATQQDRDNIMNAARNSTGVSQVRFIAKEEALRELKAILKDTAFVLDGLGENPLPDSVEIKFKSDSVTPEAVKALTAKLNEMKGVQEVEYGEKFLSSLYSIRKGVKTIGLLFVVLMAAGMLFVCYSTVKILFYRRLREIETYKLLGATRLFIRAPFLIEGAVIGLLGGILGLVGMLMMYYLVLVKFSLAFPFLHSVIFPIDMSFLLPLAGLFLGITGAAIAIGRIRY